MVKFFNICHVDNQPDCYNLVRCYSQKCFIMTTIAKCLALDTRDMDNPARITDPGDSWWNEPHWQHYAVSDVFFGEVCVLSTICKNAWQLFSVRRGEDFVCDYDEDGYRELVAGLLGRRE